MPLSGGIHCIRDSRVEGAQVQLLRPQDAGRSLSRVCQRHQACCRLCMALPRLGGEEGQEAGRVLLLGRQGSGWPAGSGPAADGGSCSAHLDGVAQGGACLAKAVAPFWWQKYAMQKNRCMGCLQLSSWSIR